MGLRCWPGTAANFPLSQPSLILTKQPPISLSYLQMPHTWNFILPSVRRGKNHSLVKGRTWWKKKDCGGLREEEKKKFLSIFSLDLEEKSSKGVVYRFNGSHQLNTVKGEKKIPIGSLNALLLAYNEMIYVHQPRSPDRNEGHILDGRLFVCVPRLSRTQLGQYCVLQIYTRMLV